MKKFKAASLSLLFVSIIAIMALMIFAGGRGAQVDAKEAATTSETSAPEQLATNPTIAALLQNFPTKAEFENIFKPDEGRQLTEYFILYIPGAEPEDGGFSFIHKDAPDGSGGAIYEGEQLIREIKLDDPAGARAGDILSAYDQEAQHE